MAHYAYIDENNIVVNVIVGRDENELIDGLEPEIYYAQGTDYIVKRTSYNGRIRARFAGIGDTYDPLNDVFITPSPFPSWKLNQDFEWQAPKPKPEGDFYWSEEEGEWLAYEEEISLA
jgi:hypothetical protein